MFEQELLPSLQTARSRYLNTLSNLKADELPLKLAPESNSIGFLIRHIAEVEFRFCTMFFARPLPDYISSLATIGPVKDEGNFTDMNELLAICEASYDYLVDALTTLPQDAWDVACEAPIGTLTPRQALGRLIYHMGYHGGQIGLIRKYGGAK
ncbi:DinB family protein [Brevibacillus parabrevis]|uniref:DinB family protein n=1 Tax=Brevibacillus parabrevis TaxID=54914 RepID=UPI0023800680|nr:DinB family protein [Brevibacillus parabrevis]WDV96278.1 DinB family protein [Brevibacillus parabrevis]